MSKQVVEIFLANPRGFCAGVDRAIDIVEAALNGGYRKITGFVETVQDCRGPKWSHTMYQRDGGYIEIRTIFTSEEEVRAFFMNYD